MHWELFPIDCSPAASLCLMIIMLIVQIGIKERGVHLMNFAAPHHSSLNLGSLTNTLAKLFYVLGNAVKLESNL